MGLLNKAITSTRVKAAPISIGSWLDEYSEALPVLSKRDLVTLATHRALLSIDPGKNTSSYVLPGQRRVAFGERTARAVYTMLRSQPLAAIVSGAPSPYGDFTTDWI